MKHNEDVVRNIFMGLFDADFEIVKISELHVCIILILFLCFDFMLQQQRQIL